MIRSKTIKKSKSGIKPHSRETQVNTLEILNLHAECEGKKILKGVNLTIKSNEIHAVMGPNGSGKSTLCKVIMGHPRYTATKGSIKFNGQEILQLPTHKRAKLGLFLAFQQPVEIPGVNMRTFLRHAKKACPLEFMDQLIDKLDDLKMSSEYLKRPLNEGFSGGEKKKAEIFQMAILEPKISLIDEIDSGLDIDALKIVSKNIMETHQKNKMGILLITHYQRILNYVIPQFVHIISNGKIIKSGNKELVSELEEKGYEKLT